MKQAIGLPNDALKERAPRCEIVRFKADRKKDLVGYKGQVRCGAVRLRLTLSVDSRGLCSLSFPLCACWCSADAQIIKKKKLVLSPPRLPDNWPQTLKGIEENFGVALDLSTEGKAVVFSDNAANVAGAVKLVRELVHDIEEVRRLVRFVVPV